MNQENIALYIHIPFCPTKCHYCSFAIITEKIQKKEYLTKLNQELKQQLIQVKNQGKQIETIYFGGGTPSTLEPSEIEAILKTIWDVLPNKENIKAIEFEMNPEHATQEYIENLNKLGITRVSMGIQSLDPDILKSAGRAHTKEHSLEAAKILSKSKLTYSFDLILGLPKKNQHTTITDIKTLLQFHPNHLSIYFLTIEPGTHFQLLPNNTFPKEEQIINEYEAIKELLGAEGYIHYEISNWAKPGYESKHNLMYWTGKEYIGVGLNAGSFFDKKRWSNYKNFKKYLTEDPTFAEDSVEVLSQRDCAETYLLTSLRLIKGAELKILSALLREDEYRVLEEKITNLQNRNLLLRTDSHIAIPEQKRIYQNIIVQELLF